MICLPAFPCVLRPVHRAHCRFEGVCVGGPMDPPPPHHSLHYLWFAFVCFFN